MFKTQRSWIIALVGIGITLIAAGLTPLWIAHAQEATPEATPEIVLEATAEAEIGALVTPEVGDLYDTEPLPEVTGNNSYCLICHSQPWQSVTLGDGTIHNLYVDPVTVAESVHGTSSPTGTLGCTDCHGADAFPHNNPTPADGRAYAIYAVALCGRCHQEEVDSLRDGLHEQAIISGNTEAAVCTDCHGAHNVQPVVEEPELIAGVCGDCHENTLAEWRVSGHNEIGPLGCATCHSPHSQQIRVGNSSDELCINCHDDTEEKFVHTQHRGQGDAAVECVDCHMYTGAPDRQLVLTSAEFSVFDQVTGHTMLMSATPCTTCHEELVSTGQWDQLIAERVVVVAPTALPPELAPEGDELDTAMSQSSETSYVPLIQGLILGLGFGVTFAAIFIARGNRPTQLADEVVAEAAPPASAAVSPEPPPAAHKPEDHA